MLSDRRPGSDLNSRPITDSLPVGKVVECDWCSSLRAFEEVGLVPLVDLVACFFGGLIFWGPVPASCCNDIGLQDVPAPPPPGNHAGLILIIIVT